MGLLSQGKPMNWDETKKYAKFVQKRGIEQFINIYNKSKDRADGPFKWGDEVEYMLIKFDRADKIARVSLKAQRVLRKIAERHQIHPPDSTWHPEFAAYMVEGTPGIPYGTDGQLIDGLCNMEKSMQFRRNEVQHYLDIDETVISLTSFPRLGCKNFSHPIYQPKPETGVSRSLFLPDESIYNGHPRYKTVVKNIGSRRKRKVIINVPIFKDINTPKPFFEKFNDIEAKQAVKPNYVYMDAMGFGMGCCCLQITLQATHLAEAKVLFDQLAPICPIALTISAASPIHRGYMTDIDCRWQIISACVDDRTQEESGEIDELKESEYRISKSRYDSISTYLSKKGQEYNDIPLAINQAYYDMMVARGVDSEVARHVAHLFIRDPIALYKEKLDQSDDELDHFENIQSTNWQTMRFKPPPGPDSPIGWRVEFRPLEAQITDFENAAYSVFVILLSRVILAYKLNFLIPISLVDQNMVEAQKRDAVIESKFWFRRDLMPKNNSKEPLSTVLNNSRSSVNNTNSKTNGNSQTTVSKQNTNGVKGNESCARLMTADEIINGSDDFVGLLPIINHYVNSLNDGTNSENIALIKKYLKLISDRAALRAMTTARWIRQYVNSHPKYKHDSVVSDQINYDLMCEFDKMAKGLGSYPELLGDSSATQVNGCAELVCNESQNAMETCNCPLTPEASSASNSNNKRSCHASSNVNRLVKCCLHPSTEKSAACHLCKCNMTIGYSRSVSR